MNAKILKHSSGLGLVDRETVRRRAMELATIAGREPGKFTESDWLEAKRELHGGNHFPDPADSEAIFSGHDGVAGTPGSHVQHQNPEPEETVGEELVNEGSDEALHDLMLEARRNTDDQED